MVSCLDIPRITPSSVAWRQLSLYPHTSDGQQKRSGHTVSIRVRGECGVVVAAR